MSQRMWVVVIVALLIGILAAGILWRALQDQSTLQAPGSWHGVPSVNVRAGAPFGIDRAIG